MAPRGSQEAEEAVQLFILMLSSNFHIYIFISIATSSNSCVIWHCPRLLHVLF